MSKSQIVEIQEGISLYKLIADPKNIHFWYCEKFFILQSHQKENF